MEQTMTLNPIGVIHAKNGRFGITIDKKHLPGLTALEGFSHIQILWWGNLYASPEQRNFIVAEKPYKKGPDSVGVFATRSPVRPNPILTTTIFVQELNFEKGTIVTPFIDAEDNTPVLDIKPYHPSERVRDVHVPEWCGHWPQWDEDAAAFNWQAEFNFPS